MLLEKNILTTTKPSAMVLLTQNFQRILNSLASAKNMVYSQTNLYPKDLDTISKETGLDVTVVTQLLLDLQLQGVIREVSKNCYVRCGI